MVLHPVKATAKALCYTALLGGLAISPSPRVYLLRASEGAAHCGGLELELDAHTVALDCFLMTESLSKCVALRKYGAKGHERVVCCAPFRKEMLACYA